MTVIFNLLFNLIRFKKRIVVGDEELKNEKMQKNYSGGGSFISADWRKQYDMMSLINI